MPHNIISYKYLFCWLSEIVSVKSAWGYELYTLIYLRGEGLLLILSGLFWQFALQE